MKQLLLYPTLFVLCLITLSSCSAPESAEPQADLTLPPDAAKKALVTMLYKVQRERGEGSNHLFGYPVECFETGSPRMLEDGTCTVGQFRIQLTEMTYQITVSVSVGQPPRGDSKCGTERLGERRDYGGRFECREGIWLATDIRPLANARGQ